MSKLPQDDPEGPSRHRAAIGRAVAAQLERDPSSRRAPTAAAQIYHKPDFLTPDECEPLMRLIDADLRPATVFGEGDWTREFRTSEFCGLDYWTDEGRPVDDRIGALLGLPAENGEMLQGQRYLPGQQYRAHCDWFERDQPYWPQVRAQGGQRTWTAMIYLNAVEEGGATWFPRAGVRFAPRPGMLLAWNNLRPDGSANPDTIHEGTRVVAGAKYILTKWFRESAWEPMGHRSD